ncbi:hypothetical protein [Leptothoe sp. PORK10 BA2]|uniref:hypothetical protein n=1 Tax=Leptothoe sp. PORK10 BA2 TaxID=3110254 RepID=UPI002B1F47AA|nr:hypothetical protein [Leptothoe sp. PORK10 BA2]MEA5462525.1 hypothetical protein [Leptothoe sp. PORK10 BA2]
MAASLKHAVRFTGLAGLMGLISCIPSGFAGTIPPVDAQPLSALDLQPLEYRLDVPGRGQVVTTSITFTEFMDSEGFDYGAVLYLPTHETESDFTLIHHDLNGDGFEDVLVPLMVLPKSEQDANSGDDGHFALAVVLNQQGRPVHRDTAFFGMIHEVELIDDQIVVSGAAELWGNETTYTYRWTETGLRLLSRESINLDTIPFPQDRQQYFDYNVEQSRFSEAGAVDDPLALTRTVLGDGPEAEEPSEIILDVLEATDQRVVIGYSRKQLEDDSVYAKRLRLEFVPDGDQWRIDWIGQQFSCQVGRGRQTWHNSLCS